VSDGNGDTASAITTITVTEYLPLSASFTFSNTTAFEWNFVDTSSGGISPLSHFWNFGDGSSSSVQNPTHIYASTGTYTVVLTVTDNDGGESEYWVEIVIIPPELGPVDEIIPGYSTGIIVFSVGLMVFIIRRQNLNNS